MKVAPALLLATVFALNLSAPAATSAAPALREPLDSLQLLTLDVDARRVGSGRPSAALTSTALPLLGMGLLGLLAARILRSRR